MAEERVVGVDRHVYYGKCETAADVSIKEVIIQNPTYTKESINDVDTIYLDLEVGDQLIITFANGNTSVAPTLSLFVNDSNTNIGISGNSGRVVIASRIDINCNLMWEAGDLISFIYTELNDQSYWKMNVTSPATSEKFGTVKIAGEDADVTTLDEQTAVTYNLIKDLITDSNEALELDWEYSPEEGEWGKINLTSNEVLIDDVVIPQIIANVSDLTNDGDGSPNSKFLTNNKDISFLNTGMGVGYSYNTIEEEKIVEKTVRNFIPYDPTIIYEDEPVVLNANNVRVGYGSLEAYQEVFVDENDNVIELNPSTWIYGKTIYDAFDENGSLQIGTIDIPNGHDFDPLYSFNKDSVNFTKPLTVPSITAANDIDAESITTTGLTVNGYTVINGNETVTGTLNVKGLSVDGTEIKNLIDSRISPLNVTVNWPGAGDNFVIKIVSTGELTAEPRKNYLYNGYANMKFPLPSLSGYQPIGIVGYNIDQYASKDHSWDARMWECYLDPDNKKVCCAILNDYDTKSTILVYIYVLYVKNSWR